jgi:hypothetical protein
METPVMRAEHHAVWGWGEDIMFGLRGVRVTHQPL